MRRKEREWKHERSGGGGLLLLLRGSDQNLLT